MKNYRRLDRYENEQRSKKKTYLIIARFLQTQHLLVFLEERRHLDVRVGLANSARLQKRRLLVQMIVHIE